MRGLYGLALSVICCAAQAGGPNDFWMRPDGVRPWLSTQLGTEDEVPPPWTKPEALPDGYQCWGRRYAFGGAGLVTSVVSAGQELLAAPIALEVNGRALSFVVRQTAVGASYADYELLPKDAPIPLMVRLRAEFDGFLWFDVTWGGDGAAEVRDLKVRFPMKRELVIAQDRCRRTRDDQPLPPGKRGEWTFDPLNEPYFWLGNDTLGMMGGIESLRGWHLADKARGYRLSVTDKAAEQIMTVVDKAVTPTEPRTFGFYVEATPSKPKNLELAALPASSLERWCQVDTIFDFKWPGYYKEGKCEKLRKLQQGGKRVFYYGSTTAVSPNTPLWERYGADWTSSGSPTSGIVKSMKKNRQAGSWTRGCMNCRDFFEYKIYSAAGFLSDPKYEVMDLYYDVAEPWNCQNAAHGCVWKDAFGTVCRDFQLRNCREFHKRLLRLLKRKNPKGVLYGHSGPSRTPSDVFFERMVMGENYAYSVKDTESYFDVLTPDELRIKYASRSNETVIDMLPQIVRAFQMRRPERAKTYNVDDPVADRAIRHCAAYYKIYDLNIWGNAANRFDGNQWISADDAVTRLGPDRRYRAYYHADAPLKAVESDPRFLWAVFSGKGEGLLILLNDTDEPVTRTLIGDLADFGVSNQDGRDVFGNGTYIFADGKLTVTLPPRESRFIEFSEKVPEQTNAAAAHRLDSAKESCEVVFLGDSVAGKLASGLVLENVRSLDFSFPGDCAMDLSCRLDHGLLEWMKPHVVVLSVGSDNAGRRGKSRMSPTDTILDIQSVLNQLMAVLPESKVILLPVASCGATNESVRTHQGLVNPVLGRLADGDRVLWCEDSGRLASFVDYALGRGPKPQKGRVPAASSEGPRSISPELRLCWLGLPPWNQKPRLRIKRAEMQARADRQYDAVWIGDSITHFWERKENVDVFREKFGRYKILNLGFAGDRTENVLWDIKYGGFLDGASARLVALLVGTNNAWKDTPEEIVAGIEACVSAIREKQPQAKILLYSLLPREVARQRGKKNFRRKDPNVDAILPKLMRVNELIRLLADGKTVICVDLTATFTDAEGLPNITLLDDGTHPNAAGYRAWADAVLPLYRQILGEDGCGEAADDGAWSMR